jgi:dienelactone hydrolase
MGRFLLFTFLLAAFVDTRTMLRRPSSSIYESRSAGVGVRETALRIREARAVALRAITVWRKTFAALVLASFLVICATVWPFARAHLQALAVLRLIAGQPVPWVAARLVMEPTTTEEVQIPGEPDAIRARLYRPVKHRNAPGLVVLHGVHHLGMNEPRLMGFASAMASCGLQVLTPELPGIRDYHIDQSSVQVIGESTRWFAQKTGGPVGVMGLSFSGGLALVSASDPVYRPDFKFVLAVGSQDNMDHVTQFYLTGAEARPDGSIERLRAHEYGALVLEYEHLEDFVPAEDIEAIRRVLREHLYEDKAAENLAAQKLNERQKLETLQLMDSSSVATLAKLAVAQAKHVQEMEALSPHGRLRNMTTAVFLLHGQADNIIPSAETLWMASELPSTALQAVLVSPVLSHVDVSGSKPGAWDEWRLVHFFSLVMDAARRK